MWSQVLYDKNHLKVSLGKARILEDLIGVAYFDGQSLFILIFKRLKKNRTYISDETIWDTLLNKTFCKKGVRATDAPWKWWNFTLI